MTETTTDWGVLARALAADGVAEELLFEPSGLEVCGNPDCRPCAADVQAWRASGRVLRDFTCPAVIWPVAEAWRLQAESSRRYLVRSCGYHSSATAVVEWAGDEDRIVRAESDPASVDEGLALALLAWAEAQEVRDGGE